MLTSRPRANTFPRQMYVECHTKFEDRKVLVMMIPTAFAGILERTRLYIEALEGSFMMRNYISNFLAHSNQ